MSDTEPGRGSKKVVDRWSRGPVILRHTHTCTHTNKSTTTVGVDGDEKELLQLEAESTTSCGVTYNLFEGTGVRADESAELRLPTSQHDDTPGCVCVCVCVCAGFFLHRENVGARRSRFPERR